MYRILVVDDEIGVCHSFKKVLGRHGYEVHTASDGVKAIEMIEKVGPDLVIMDVTMPGMDGIETLKVMKSLRPDLIIILMTAYSSSERAIKAMKYGAYDYLTKPFENSQLIALIEKALIEKKVSVPVTFEEDEEFEGDRIIGKSPLMLEIFKKIGQVADMDVTVLIRGETGTGKELIARAIYQHSRRADKPFIPVNCSAIPETLLESELFGYEKGAFTGADSMRPGKFEQCNGGTMFLDEIGDMPLSIQAKWLRVLQDGCFQRIGGKEFIHTDVRIIAATNKDLEALVKKGKFREDLYWRLNVVSITIPPLRERKEDIEPLVNYFIKKYNRAFKKDIKGVEPSLLKKFKDYHWPGNVRELEGIIQRGMILCQKKYLSIDDCEWPSSVSEVIQSKDLEAILSGVIDEIIAREGIEGYKRAVSSFEKIFIKKALDMCDNNQVAASRLLGISRNTLRSKLEEKGE